jgi:hypothetical protein
MFKECKATDIWCSRVQVSETGLDCFGKNPGNTNFKAIACYDTVFNPFTTALTSVLAALRSSVAGIT